MKFFRNLLIGTLCAVFVSPVWALTPTVTVRVPENKSGIVIKTANLKGIQSTTTNNRGIAYFNGKNCEGVWLNQVKVCAEYQGYKKACATFKGCAAEIRMQKETEKKQTTTPAANDKNTTTSAKKDCGNVGQKECGGSYYVCKKDTDCTKANGTLPSNAIEGHCVNVGRANKVCTATKCNDEYKVVQGHCDKDNTPVNSTPVPSETPVAEAPAVETPAVETPAVETPAVETPAVETQTPTPDVNGDTVNPVIVDEPELEDCTLAELEALHASSGEKPVGGECVAMICATGYHFQEPEKVVCVKNDDIPAAEVPTGETPATETPNNETSDETSDDAGDDTETPAPSVDNVKEIAEAESAYSDAKANEQSLANRMLGGLTMAATGVGGMQLAQGLAERSADAAAEQDMAAYLATFQCKIGDAGGKSYSGGEMAIEVGGTNQLVNLYQQYVDLAADLKERKAALGMAPGIESQVIMDKANMGLYDAEGGKGIENGTFASLYRASRGNETDANKLADQQNTSATRVKGGAIAAGVGAIGGAIGNSAINGKIADLIKDAKTKNANNKDNKAAIEELKKGLTSAGFKNVNKLDFSSLDISGLKGKLSGVDWSGLTNKFAGQDVTQVLNTTNASSFSSSLTELLGQ